MAKVEFHITKHELTGQPVVKATLPTGLKRDDISKVHDFIFTDVLERIGLERCMACTSGLGGITLEEQYADVMVVDLSQIQKM